MDEPRSKREGFVRVGLLQKNSMCVEVRTRIYRRKLHPCILNLILKLSRQVSLRR